MNYVLKNQIIRLGYFLIPSAETRSKLLKKNHFFYYMGENVHFQPRHLPADPKYIKLHNNICIASGVEFITHDIIHKVLNNLSGSKTEYKSHIGCIEIMDNVFIGAGTKIMPGVRIGPNVIVAAGTIVTKDIAPGCVVGGAPAKIIDSFNALKKKRLKESLTIKEDNREKRVLTEWKKFKKKRLNANESVNKCHYTSL